MTLYYRSVRQLSGVQAERLERAAEAANAQHVWELLEPITFLGLYQQGCLFGASRVHVENGSGKLLPATELLAPLMQGLSQLSQTFRVAWELSHNRTPGPIGYIRRGACDLQLMTQVAALGDLGASRGPRAAPDDSSPSWDAKPANNPGTAARLRVWKEPRDDD